MLLRYEQKYLVAYDMLELLRKRIEPFVYPDTHTSEDLGFPQYTVRSIYYDSYSLDAVDEKLEGVELRKKFRIRVYDKEGPNSKVFLEIKRKIADRIMKHRCKLNFSDLYSLMENKDLEAVLGTENAKNLEDGQRFFFGLIKHNMNPLNRITYEREAYHGKFDQGVRITFDKNIRSKLYPNLNEIFEDNHNTFVWKSGFILEIKYFEAPMPSWLKNIVAEFNLKQQALSKYVEGYYCHALNPQ